MIAVHLRRSLVELRGALVRLRRAPMRIRVTRPRGLRAIAREGRSLPLCLCELTLLRRELLGAFVVGRPADLITRHVRERTPDPANASAPVELGLAATVLLLRLP